ncbi:hypothetical protein [Mycobacterium sp. E1747]|uniref:hypothetical protein n=1 Tax=Mycobacterium sp. E1747 TaxID=1834128 RepID=UPI0012EA56E3|nr:hypothetical protein [Mycobacterium sp. E1747]
MIKSGAFGDYDDTSFTDAELLYRRVPDKPSFLTQRDPITGKRRPQPAAFSIRQEPDGLSIVIHGLVRALRLKTKHLCNWETHGVARFAAGHVRPKLGVIAAADPNSPHLGQAHGLIRGPEGIPPASVWNPIRDEILAHVEFFESDPDPATDTHSALDVASGAIGMCWKLLGWLRRCIG